MIIRINFVSNKYYSCDCKKISGSFVMRRRVQEDKTNRVVRKINPFMVITLSSHILVKVSLY